MKAVVYRPEAPRRPAPRALTLRNESYFELRRQGVHRCDAATRFGLPGATMERLENQYRDELSPGGTDASCPRFALHDEHVRDVVAAGGYPRWSERRGSTGQPIVFAPLIPFGGEGPCVS